MIPFSVSLIENLQFFIFYSRMQINYRIYTATVDGFGLVVRFTEHTSRDYTTQTTITHRLVFSVPLLLALEIPSPTSFCDTCNCPSNTNESILVMLITSRHEQHRKYLPTVLLMLHHVGMPGQYRNTILLLLLTVIA
jgi:hypothetical protein